jgi:hypothetical protein
MTSHGTGESVEQAIDDHDARERYANGAALIDEFAGMKR